MGKLTYHVRHTTQYDYHQPVSLCQNDARVVARQTPNQTPRASQLSIEPEPKEVIGRTDYFGNLVNYFAIDFTHERLTVTAENEVEVIDPKEMNDAAAVGPLFGGQPFADEATTGDATALQFAFDSPQVRRGDRFREYALKSFLNARPIREAAIELTERIHEDFTYDSTATQVHTPTETVFEMRRGVCQDLAHVQLACLRSLNIPARYVSGYLRTLPPPGKPRLVGADASHAWVSVYLGNGSWLDLDPTNRMLVGQDHITLAWGRDYADVCPLHGVFVGGNQHSLTVSVDVRLTDEKDPSSML